jgi:drug/metabolite transporter (DMT)-like permease
MIVWISILGLGLGSTSIAYVLFYRLIDETGPTIAITVTFLVPVFSVLWGDVFLNEHPTLQMMLGGIVIVIGTSLAVGLWSPKSKQLNQPGNP